MYMTANVAIMDSGTDTLGISVAQNVRRNMKIVPTTNPIVISSVFRTSATEARIVLVRSDTTETLMAGGNDASSRGNSAWMWPTVSMALAPGESRMLRMTALLLPNQPAMRLLAGSID